MQKLWLLVLRVASATWSRPSKVNSSGRVSQYTAVLTPRVLVYAVLHVHTKYASLIFQSSAHLCHFQDSKISQKVP
ncbi:hypothetical protein QBC46DRAFT_372416 [Diplogelasinospora grovesii]|uniref:Secreted protein n=1 Tax=Diplogelasinospora grovesii TaxID=303347 RepID=A0AAN6S9G6_9PEZI|nr:hypothetical protein QBC46DRAFT_372416 [Diplogelasinospora grovesii]